MSFKYQKYGFKTEEKFGSAIRQMYEDGSSQREIAETLKCSRLTIIKAFKHFHIDSIRRNELYRKCGLNSEKDMANKFQELYQKGLSQREISKLFKVSIVPVTRIFQKYEIPIRSNSEALGILQKDVQLDEQETQIIEGLLLGSGFIKRKKYTAYLQYPCLHKEVIEDIAQKLHRLETNYRFRKNPQREWYQIRTMSYMCLADLHDQWYHEKIKRMPDLELTPESCYWWYIGDGSTAPEALKLFIGTDNIDALLKKIPVKTTWYKAHNQFPTVYIAEPKDRIKFLEYIGPCRHSSCSYKWKVYAGNKLIADLTQ